MALLDNRINIEEAAFASRLEVNAQIQQWGKVMDAHDVDEEDLKVHLGAVKVASLQ